MLFDNPPITESRPIALLRKAIIVVVSAFLLVGIVSSHRAFYQVRSLEVTTANGSLQNGALITIGVVTSGRTNVDLKLELIQGTHAETLAEQRVQGNEYGFLDPRSKQATLSYAITPELLSRYQSGLGILRATAFGNSQWTRIPPPVIREIPIEIGSR